MNGTRGLLRASDSTRKREVVDVPMEGTTKDAVLDEKVDEKKSEKKSEM